MYFSFFKLKKWGKRRLRLADTIVRCCLRIEKETILMYCFDWKFWLWQDMSALAENMKREMLYLSLDDQLCFRECTN